MSAEDLSYHTSAANLWILIECTFDSTGTYYKVISATDVVAPREQMHTGKSIKYRIGKTVFDGTIVIISDDKNFLETELVQMQKKITSTKQQHPFEEIVSKKNMYKQRRINNETTNPPIGLNNQLPVRLPSPAWSNNTNDLSNQSTICQTIHTTNIPPMTFDQQTQTDLSNLPNDTSIHSKISDSVLLNLEDIANEQKRLQTSNYDTKEQLNSISIECQQIRIIVEEILKRLDKATSVIVEEHELDQQAQPLQKDEEHYIYASGQMQSKSSTPNKILNFKSNDFSNVEIVDYINQDSNGSMSTNEHQLLNGTNSIYGSLYNSSSNLLEKSSNSTGKKAVKRKYASKTAEQLKRDWSDNENDEDLQEQVPIGNNQTTVPRYILKRINWASHTSATRKLLTSLFSRETLASHSLTGKPSPGKTFQHFALHYNSYNKTFYISAFIDSDKAVKKQLDSKIISDVIQCVMMNCKVSETAVRSSITTKCADENKMMRQRQDKNRKALNPINGTNLKLNKENRISNTSVTKE